MTKVLAIFKHSPVLCTISLTLGIGLMLSVAYLDPSDSSTIRLRQAVGSVFLLLPGIAQSVREEE